MELIEYAALDQAPKDESFILAQRFDPPPHQGVVVGEGVGHQADIDAKDAEHRVDVAARVAAVHPPSGFTADAQTWAYEEDGSIVVRTVMLLTPAEPAPE